MPDKAEDVLSESVMTTGDMVGDLVRSYFGIYDLVEFDYDKDTMPKKTKEYMEAGSENIAEAAFCIDGLYCAVDILHRDADGYDIVEVKSSTYVSDIYVEDMAFQYYVLSRCGVNVKKVFIMYLDNSYVRYGELELDKLFVLEDYTDTVLNKTYEVEENIRNIREYVNTEEEPERDIDLYCEEECAVWINLQEKCRMSFGKDFHRVWNMDGHEE